MYSTENIDLEKAANALLGEGDSSLFNNDDLAGEDALDLADEDPSLNKTKHWYHSKLPDIAGRKFEKYFQ